jgi:hypothetical protein
LAEEPLLPPMEHDRNQFKYLKCTQSIPLQDMLDWIKPTFEPREQNSMKPEERDRE